MIPIILHERQANWARQVSPGVASWPVRVHESRSALDLERLVVRSELAPVLLVDLGNGPCRCWRISRGCSSGARTH